MSRIYKFEEKANGLDSRNAQFPYGRPNSAKPLKVYEHDKKWQKDRTLEIAEHIISHSCNGDVEPLANKQKPSTYLCNPTSRTIREDLTRAQSIEALLKILILNATDLQKECVPLALGVLSKKLRVAPFQDVQRFYRHQGWAVLLELIQIYGSEFSQSQLYHIISSLAWMPKVSLGRSIDTLVGRVEALLPENPSFSDLSSYIWGLAKLGCNRTNLVHDVAQHISRRQLLKTADPKAISNLFWGVSNILRAAYGLFNDQNRTAFVSKKAVMLPIGPRESFNKSRSPAHCLKRDELDGYEDSRVLVPFLEQAYSVWGIPGGLDTYLPQSISNIIYALARLSTIPGLEQHLPPQSLLSTFSSAAISVAPSASPQSLANMAWSLIKLGHYDEQPLACFAGLAAARAQHFKPIELGNLLCASATCGVKHAPLLLAVEQYISTQSTILNAHDITEFLYGFTTLEHAPQAHTLWLLDSCLEKHLGNIDAYHLATALWAFASLDYWPYRLMSTFVARLEVLPTEGKTTDFGAGKHIGKVHTRREPAPSKQLPTRSSVHSHRDMLEDTREGSTSSALYLQSERCQLRCFRDGSMTGADVARITWAVGKLLSGSADKDTYNEPSTTLQPEVASGTRTPNTAPYWNPRVRTPSHMREAAKMGLAHLSLPLIPTLTSQEMVMVLWGLASLRAPVTQLLEEASSVLISRHLPAMTARQLPVMLWSVARLMTACQGKLAGVTPLSLFSTAAPYMAGLLGKMTEQGLAMSVWGYASSQSSPGDAALTAIAHEVLSRPPLRNIYTLSTLAWSLSRIDFSHPTLYNRLALDALALMTPESPLGAVRKVPSLLPRSDTNPGKEPRWLPLIPASSPESPQGADRKVPLSQPSPDTNLGGKFGWLPLTPTSAQLPSKRPMAPASGRATLPVSIPDPVVARPLRSGRGSEDGYGSIESEPSRQSRPVLVPPASLACLALAFARSGCARADIMTAIASQTSRQLSTLTACEAASILWSLAAVRHAVSESLVADLLCIVSRPRGSDPSSVLRPEISDLDLGRFAAVESTYDPESQQMAVSIMHRSAQGVSMAPKVDQEASPQIKDPDLAVNERLIQFESGRLSSRVKRKEPKVASVDQDISDSSWLLAFQAAEDDQTLATHHTDALTTQADQSVALHAAHEKTETNSPLHAISPVKLEDQKPCKPGLMAMSLIACATMRYKPSAAVLNGLCNSLESAADRLSSLTLCDVLWASCSLSHVPLNLAQRVMELLERRICQRRLEVLTLKGALKTLWALSFCGLNRNRLYTYLAVRVLNRRPTPLALSTPMRCMLAETIMMMGAEMKRSTWRALKRRWFEEIKLASQGEVGIVQVLAATGLPETAAAAALSSYHRTKRAVNDSLARMKLRGIWYRLPQGDEVCALLVPRGLAAASPPLQPPTAKSVTSRSASPLVTNRGLFLQSRETSSPPLLPSAAQNVTAETVGAAGAIRDMDSILPPLATLFSLLPQKPSQSAYEALIRWRTSRMYRNVFKPTKLQLRRANNAKARRAASKSTSGNGSRKKRTAIRHGRSHNLRGKGTGRLDTTVYSNRAKSKQSTSSGNTISHSQSGNASGRGTARLETGGHTTLTTSRTRARGTGTISHRRSRTQRRASSSGLERVKPSDIVAQSVVPVALCLNAGWHCSVNDGSPLSSAVIRARLLKRYGYVPVQLAIQELEQLSAEQLCSRLAKALGAASWSGDHKRSVSWHLGPF